MSFHLTLTIEGPERTVETNYGARQERDTLARIAVPVVAEHAWALLAYIVDAVNRGTALVVLTDEEREQVIADMTRPLR